MRSIFKLAGVCMPLLAIMACNPSANPEEESRIDEMDSTTMVVKSHTDSLEDQTEKVEASLEKLEKEFDEQ